MSRFTGSNPFDNGENEPTALSDAVAVLGELRFDSPLLISDTGSRDDGVTEAALADSVIVLSTQVMDAIHGEALAINAQRDSDQRARFVESQYRALYGNIQTTMAKYAKQGEWCSVKDDASRDAGVRPLTDTATMRLTIECEVVVRVERPQHRLTDVEYAQRDVDAKSYYSSQPYSHQRLQSALNGQHYGGTIELGDTLTTIEDEGFSVTAVTVEEMTPFDRFSDEVYTFEPDRALSQEVRGLIEVEA
jgi:hypothetical protein